MFNVIGINENGTEIIIETNMTEAQAFKFCESCNWLYDNKYTLEIRPVKGD